MSNKNSLLRLTTTALMAALCFVAFTYLKINVPTPFGYTAFHLGNSFCVLASLLLGGVSGGVAGAIGMSIADLMDPIYVMVAPKTMILKFLIGFVTGLFAHKIFKIRKLSGKEFYIKTFLSALIGMLTNVFASPVFSYFYYQFILKMPDKASLSMASFNALATSVNAVMAVIVACLLYFALYSRFKNNDLLNRLAPKYKD